MLEGKKILIGITGSIAAYKTISLIRLLVKDGAEVKVIMTSSARDFVTPLTLSTLSKNPVLTDLSTNENWSNHVMLGRWADLMLIAPLSCNTLAKMANGQCDNLLLATYLSAIVPVLVAPAMDEDMWKHPSTKSNLDKLTSFGNKVLPVEEGELASGLHGPGRMAEPEAMLKSIRDFFFKSGQLAGKTGLVTAGPTYEAIDPVRFIGNHSSGKMGIAIASELANRGMDVTLVLGPSTETNIPGSIKLIRVVSGAEMFDACNSIFGKTDLAIMSAAVADYRPAEVANEKIKKKEENINIELTKTRDILKTLGAEKKSSQVLVGFALETTNELENAKDKLKIKNADLIVLNSLRDKGAGFALDTNKVTVIGRDNFQKEIATMSKKDVATKLIDIIIEKYYA